MILHGKLKIQNGKYSKMESLNCFCNCDINEVDCDNL